MSDEELTPEEMDELKRYFGSGSGAPHPEEKYSVHKFLSDVSTSDDTTKTGNLTEPELGIPINPVRTNKDLALISRDILNNDFFVNHFLAESEITTSTSLSKDAKLLSLAVTSTRQVADVTKRHKPNKGWFKKKNDSSE